MEQSEAWTPDQSGTVHPGAPRASLFHTRLAGSEGTAESEGDVPKAPGEECPVCTEPFQTQGDHVAAVLLCNHPVCRRCLRSVQRASRDPGRLRCPLCRQTTPLPQWDLLVLQEDTWGGGADPCQAGQRDGGTDPRSRDRRMRIHSLCLYVSVLVLLLVLLGFLLSRHRA